MMQRGAQYILSTCIATALVAAISTAQPFQSEFRSIPFSNLPNADVFTGGIDIPAVQFLDIDGDGGRDLFLLDRDGHLTYYKNVGTSLQPDFRLESLDFQHLQVGAWFKFADIDGDGDADLFANGPSATVTFFRNTGTASNPSFLLETAELRDTSNTPVISEAISVPAFADLDGDGDLDLFSGNSVGSIVYYENIGTPQQFHFRYVTDKYQNISIIGNTGPAIRFEGSSLAKSAMHGAMAIDFADIDGDGDEDLFWGDFFNPSLYLLKNNGSPTVPQLVLVDSTFADEATVTSAGYNMPNLVDIDGDGDLDMFITTLSGAATLNNFFYYKNQGTSFSHQFVKQTENFLRTLDVGSNSSPIFADAMVPGRFDLFLGTGDGAIVHYVRGGTANQPQFTLDTAFIVPLSGLFNISSAFGDIDGDGIKELMVGDANGKLRLFKNAGGWSLDTSFALKNVLFGQNAAPALVDEDADGDLDLFVGVGNGRIFFYRNDGTSSVPQFALQSNFFASIDVGDDAKPAFADLDGDGKTDLLLGSRENGLSFFRNTGTLQVPIFTLQTGTFSSLLSGFRFAPAFIDADNDGDLDLVLGNVKGGLYFYRNQRITTSVAEEGEGPRRSVLLQNYPNPFNPTTAISYQLSAVSRVRLSVFDLLGREVAVLVNGELRAGEHRVEWDASNFPAGVYIGRLTIDGIATANVKLMLVK